MATSEEVVLLVNDPIMLGILIARLDTSNTKICQLMMILATCNGIICLLLAFVYFLATREAVALLANGLIMLGTSIWSFTHLEHQSPSSNS